MLRIITGSAKGKKIESLAGEATRPTSERIKGAMFSSIQFDIENRRVLDLFAGTGQLGLEAISRGARLAVFCDSSRAAVKVITANVEKTASKESSRILCHDYTVALSMLAGKERFDIVFLDPPYATHCLPDVLRRLYASGLLADGARIVCESAKEEDVFGGDATLSENYHVDRVSRYGAACVTFLSLREVEV